MMRVGITEIDKNHIIFESIADFFFRTVLISAEC